MIVWTAQSIEVWNKLSKEGVYYAEWEHSDQDFEKPYRWLVEKMIQKIGGPDFDVPPIWAWPKRPDLRRPQNKDDVLIEYKIDESELVFSDYINWHWVLNDFHICDDRIGYMGNIAKSAKCKCPYEDQKLIEQSWNNVFEISSFEYKGKKIDRKLQVTFWELRFSNVLSMKIYNRK